MKKIFVAVLMSFSTAIIGCSQPDEDSNTSGFFPRAHEPLITNFSGIDHSTTDQVSAYTVKPARKKNSLIDAITYCWCLKKRNNSPTITVPK